MRGARSRQSRDVEIVLRDTYRLLGIVKESLSSIFDPQYFLCFRSSPVDSGSSFRTVSTEESILHHQEEQHCQLPFPPERLPDLLSNGPSPAKNRRQPKPRTNSPPLSNEKLTLSRTRTFDPRSYSVWAADRPDRPPPTTITRDMLLPGVRGGNEEETDFS